MDKKEKEYRTKLYHENPEAYKKARAEFVYGVSQNFRQKRKNQKQQMVQLEEETLQAYEEEKQDGYKCKVRLYKD